MPDASSTRPTRIVFVHSSDEHYGADRILLDLAGALTPEELAVAEFWLPTDVEHGERPLCHSLEAQGATVRHVDVPVLRRAYRTPARLLWLARRAVRLRRLLRAASPDLVYCTTSAVLPTAPVARAAGVGRVVCHVQELWSRSDAAVLSPLALACGRLVAISGPVRDALPPRLRRRTRVVLNASAEPERVVPLAGHAGSLRFLVASRWNAWKGHRTLLAAWERAGCPGHLTVLGGPPPSGDRVDVPALVRTLSDPTSVSVVGEVDGIADHLDATDVMVVPSDQPEPFGLVAIEAFARGRPVVASDGGGLADVVTDGSDGWTYPLGDADALAEVLRRLSRPDVTDAGEAARATYERRFTPRRYAADWRAALGG